MDIIKVSKKLANAHYSELKDRLIQKYGEENGSKRFESILKYIRGEYHTDRVFAMIYEGENAIEKVRALAGSTNPEEAEPISIRGKFGRINSKTGVFENVVHVSDSEASAKREIQLWFEPEELTNLIYPTKKEKIKADRIIWA